MLPSIRLSRKCANAIRISPVSYTHLRLPEHVPGFETPVSVSGQRFFADHLPGASADEQPSVGRLFFYEIQSGRDGNLSLIHI